MKKFIEKVAYYTSGNVPIHFPEDDVCCHWCPLMGTESRTDREYCRRTGEYLTAPQHTIGSFCPIEFKKEEDHE